MQAQKPLLKKTAQSSPVKTRDNSLYDNGLPVIMNSDSPTSDSAFQRRTMSESIRIAQDETKTDSKVSRFVYSVDNGLLDLKNREHQKSAEWTQQDVKLQDSNLILTDNLDLTDSSDS